MNQLLHELLNGAVIFPLDRNAENALMDSTDPRIAEWVAAHYDVPEHVVAALIRTFSPSDAGLVTMLSTHPQGPLEHMRKAAMRDHADISLQSFATRQGIDLESSQGQRIFGVLDSHRISEKPLGDIWDAALRG